MKKIVNFFRLSHQEWILFFQSIYYLGLFRFKLTVNSPRELFHIVSEKNKYINTSQSSTLLPKDITKIINFASLLIPCSTCLSKALAGNVLFAKNCYKTDLHIGVLRNNKQEIEAHAWLSYDGKIVLGKILDLHRYQEFHLGNMIDDV